MSESPPESLPRGLNLCPTNNSVLQADAQPSVDTRLDLCGWRIVQTGVAGTHERIAGALSGAPSTDHRSARGSYRWP